MTIFRLEFIEKRPRKSGNIADKTISGRAQDG